MSVSLQAPLTTAMPAWANQNALDNSRRQELTQSEIRLETPRAPSATAEASPSGALDERSPAAANGSQPAAYSSASEQLPGAARIAVARASAANDAPPQGAGPNAPAGTPPQGSGPNAPAGTPPQGAGPNAPAGTPPQGAGPNAPTDDPTRGAGANAGVGTLSAMASSVAPSEPAAASPQEGSPPAANDASANQRRLSAYTDMQSYSAGNPNVDLNQVALVA